jgi:hypothetical protein
VDNLVSLLRLAMILTAVGASLVFIVTVLGALSMFSNRTFFKPVILSRSREEALREWDEATSFEFTRPKKSWRTGNDVDVSF